MTTDKMMTDLAERDAALPKCHCGATAFIDDVNGLAAICMVCFNLWRAAGEPEECPCADHDPLDFTPTDNDRASAILYTGRKYFSATNVTILCAIARVVAETDWPSLEPDTLIALLDSLQFNADAALSAIDGE